MRIKTNWSLIVVGYSCLFVFGFLDNTRGPYFPDITLDLLLTDTQASLFFAVSSFLAVISGRMVPWLVRKLQLINVMRLGLFLLTLSCIGYSRSEYLHELLISTAFFGYGFGLINVGQNLLIIRGSTEGRRRQLISGLHSTYAIASLLAPLVVGFLTDQGWHWRNGFEAFAFLCIAGIVVTLFANDDTEIPVKSDLDELFLWRKWTPFGVVFSLYVASEVVLSTRFVLLSRRAFDATEAEAVLRLAGFFTLLFAGRLLFTFFSFRKWGNKNIIVVALVISIMGYLAGLYISHWFLVLCGLSMAPIFGVGIEYMATQFGKDTDRVISMVLAFSGLFIVAIHWFVGILSDKFGIRDAMVAGPIMLIVALFIMCFLPATRGENNA